MIAHGWCSEDVDYLDESDDEDLPRRRGRARGERLRLRPRRGGERRRGGGLRGLYALPGGGDLPPQRGGGPRRCGGGVRRMGLMGARGGRTVAAVISAPSI